MAWRGSLISQGWNGKGFAGQGFRHPRKHALRQNHARSPDAHQVRRPPSTDFMFSKAWAPKKCVTGICPWIASLLAACRLAQPCPATLETA